MEVEKLRYTIWAADVPRAIAFYTGVFGAQVARQNRTQDLLKNKLPKDAQEFCVAPR